MAQSKRMAEVEVTREHWRARFLDLLRRADRVKPIDNKTLTPEFVEEVIDGAPNEKRKVVRDALRGAIREWKRKTTQREP